MRNGLHWTAAAGQTKLSRKKMEGGKWPISMDNITTCLGFVRFSSPMVAHVLIMILDPLPREELIDAKQDIRNSFAKTYE